MNELTHYTMDERVLVNARSAIESGIEYARSSLIEHDENLGRTTLKNKLWAERMESDIAAMTDALKSLPEPLTYS